MAMGAAKIRALMQWCKEQVDGYPGVEISNFTKSFRDGLAFCAIIHRFRPELVDFYALSKENIQDNNQLAYSVAESELGIPALLDAEDMVAMTVPDRLSVITYVSQYYNYFSTKQPAGGPHVVAAESTRASGRKKKQTSPAPQSDVLSEMHGAEVCAICHKTVYMLERHHLDNKLVHRSCLRRNQMKDIGERVKSLERGAHLKRNFGASNVSPPQNAVKDPVENNSDGLDEEGSASKRRTSTPISAKGPEAPLRPNGSARHEPNSLVGHPSPVILPPDLSTLPPPAPGCPPSREVTAPAQTRIIHPSEGKPAVRPHSPLIPPAPLPAPNPSRPQAESSAHQELSDSSILRSRSPTPRLASSVHKGDSTSHYLHHKRRAPAPPPHPHPPSSAPPPRPPSIRTIPNDINRNSALSETEESDYPESLNPFCEPTLTLASPPDLNPSKSASNDSLSSAKNLPPRPKPITVRSKEPSSEVKEHHREKDVSFEYRGKNPFDDDSDTGESEPPAVASKPSPLISRTASPRRKSDDGNVSFEYRGKNPFDMDFDDDSGSHTSGSLRTSMLRKKRHAPPPPPPPPPPPSRPTKPEAVGDLNGSDQASPKNSDGSEGAGKGPEAAHSEMSPSSSTSGHESSSTEVSTRKRIIPQLRDDSPTCTPVVRALRPIRPPADLHIASDEDEEADDESPGLPGNEPPPPDGATDQHETESNTSDPWVRKGPAPAQPVAGRRCVRTDADEEFVPYSDLIAELERLNEEQVLLENKGRQLESELRNSDKSQLSCPEEAGAEESDAKTDSLMGSWLELIEKKNELFRRENELHYRIRQRELEERHADIEYELRQLLAKQEHVKTAGDRRREEELLKDLQACVTERAELVYALDEDQQRRKEKAKAQKNLEEDKHRTRVLGPKFTNVLCLSSKSKKKIKEGKKREKKERKKEKKKT